MAAHTVSSRVAYESLHLSFLPRVTVTTVASATFLIRGPWRGPSLPTPALLVKVERRRATEYPAVIRRSYDTLI